MFELQSVMFTMDEKKVPVTLELSGMLKFTPEQEFCKDGVVTEGTG